jgi:hypothetical protein
MSDFKASLVAQGKKVSKTFEEKDLLSILQKPVNKNDYIEWRTY